VFLGQFRHMIVGIRYYTGRVGVNEVCVCTCNSNACLAKTGTATCHRATHADQLCHASQMVKLVREPENMYDPK
jgi:hypothetical protein